MTTTTSEHPVIQVLILVSALGCGLVAGVFFAFSGFVMSALNRLPPAQAIAAMNSINVTAVRPPLMILMFGTAAVVIATMVAALRYAGDLPLALLLIGGGCYLLAVIALTMGYHVPLNDALALWDPNGSEAAADAARWQDHATRWTRWNHVRAAGGLAAAGSFTVALLRF